MQREAKRADRVAERVRAELAEMFLRGAVRDPRARGVIVSAVRVTDDLSLARVYVRLLEESGSRGARRAPGSASAGARVNRQEALIAALESARGHLRRALGGRLGLRRTPELAFYWDDVVDSGMRMERLLAELETGDERPSGSDDPEQEA
ncbi:MAG: ribosome-binding factor A [Deltaproteobacteria bacterium]|nr:ribosome-binding factor A [Deltaproteobacteria bacterium]